MTVTVACTRLVMLVACTSRCFLFPGWQASSAQHSGRYGPEGQLPEAYRLLVFLGDDFYEFLYSALSLARWWLHALRQSTELLEGFCVCPDSAENRPSQQPQRFLRATCISGDGDIAASSFSVSCVLGSVALGFKP